MVSFKLEKHSNNDELQKYCAISNIAVCLTKNIETI